MFLRHLGSSLYSSSYVLRSLERLFLFLVDMFVCIVFPFWNLVARPLSTILVMCSPCLYKGLSNIFFNQTKLESPLSRAEGEIERCAGGGTHLSPTPNLGN